MPTWGLHFLAWLAYSVSAAEYFPTMFRVEVAHPKADGGEAIVYAEAPVGEVFSRNHATDARRHLSASLPECDPALLEVRVNLELASAEAWRTGAWAPGDLESSRSSVHFGRSPPGDSKLGGSVGHVGLAFPLTLNTRLAALYAELDALVAAAAGSRADRVTAADDAAAAATAASSATAAAAAAPAATTISSMAPHANSTGHYAFEFGGARGELSQPEGNIVWHLPGGADDAGTRAMLEGKRRARPWQRLEPRRRDWVQRRTLRGIDPGGAAPRASHIV